MQDRLIITLNGVVQDTVPLDRPLMRLGRGADCDVRLIDPGKEVSRHHATIRRAHHEFRIKNDEGKNGTWVNRNEASTWTVLHRNDLVSIGPFVLRYTFGADSGPDDEDATMVSARLPQLPSTYLPSEIGIDQRQETQRDFDPPSAPGHRIRLRFVRGPFKGGAQVIHADGFTLGRERENTVWLNDPAVSGVHAEVYRCVDTWFLRDLDSSNGVLVNGKPITRETPLRFGDRVGIGSSVFRFGVDRPRRRHLVRWRPLALLALCAVSLAAIVLGAVALWPRLDHRGVEPTVVVRMPAPEPVQVVIEDRRPEPAPEPVAAHDAGAPPRAIPPADPAARTEPPAAGAPAPAPPPSVPALPAIPAAAEIPEPRADAPPPPEPAPTPAPPALASAVSNLVSKAARLTFLPIDPARRVRPEETVEYKSYEE